MLVVWVNSPLNSFMSKSYEHFSLVKDIRIGNKSQRIGVYKDAQGKQQKENNEKKKEEAVQE